MYLILVVACSILFFNMTLVVADYEPGERFGSAFYYTLDNSCIDIPSDGEIYDNLGFPELRKDGRFLSLIGPAKCEPVAQLNSTTLEVYIIKDCLTPIKIFAPNLRTFSILDTASVRWLEDQWVFPRLRVINLITVKTKDIVDLTTLGSSELEILRVKRVEYSKIRLNYNPGFAKLRVLELGTIGSAFLYNICPFVLELIHLEVLYLNRVEDQCIPKTLKKLWSKVKRLKVVRLYNSNYYLPDTNPCEVLPIRIEHISSEMQEGLTSTSVYDCFKKLKSLTLRLHSESATEISSTHRSVRIVSISKRFSFEANVPIRLENAVVASIQQLFAKAHQLPNLPNAEIIQFTRNGFTFAPNIEPFPNMPKVRSLDLSGNPLIYIPAGVFNKLRLLSILVLQQTKIVSFADKAFCDLLWPRALILHFSYPEDVRLFTPPGEEAIGKYYSTLSCLTQSYELTNVVIDGLQCDCARKSYQYLDQKTIRKHMGLDVIHCDQRIEDGLPSHEFFESDCPDVAPTNIVETPAPPVPMTCQSDGYLALLGLVWIIFVLFCLVPPPVLFFLHRKGMKRQLRLDQTIISRANLFIICPRHARKWCKRVVMPCLQANITNNPEPKLREFIPAAPDDARTRQTNQHSSLFPRTKTNKKKTAATSASSRSNSIHSTAEPKKRESILPENTPLKGVWAWQPRFRCQLAPPARHRLTLLLESKQVLIIFPSASLFSEPACRAQLRLAFHLCRLHLTPPPGIIVWPTTNSKANLAGNYRSINRNKSLADHDKYYPAPRFNTVTNDPDDIAEKAVIKAKVPNREEAIHIMQYFATITCPCIEWSNSKTARQNLQPLVWLFNKASRIPAY
ncbi:hypothetical protein CRM22_009085 [Opisthorchis felineus]|uniref:LRRCT domain-containing protein n=1 Tax=Opisthorchis felineus TaxID=147828 RepID=A0A4S2LG61_OPIFE|nr:hypothetical protein CRM22_009085 [Opisthorchis felineus]